MPTRGKRVALAACFAIACACGKKADTQTRAGSAKAKSLPCRRTVMEGVLQEGQGFQAEFARGLVFGMEPIRSGWAVRVVAAKKARGPHEYAEVATLPYQSVSPLLLSTDWAFRAQDAVGWTPRRFRYAATEAAYLALAKDYDGVLRGDGAASQRAVQLASAQPEGLLEIEDAKLAPGLADQTRVAAAVSAHFAQTPHTLDSAAQPSPLGRIEEVRFRISLDLPAGLEPVKGLKIVMFSCPLRPTTEGNTGIPHW